jgi:hypothetical protein
MTRFIVGPGVAQAIADNDDEARSNEIYVVTAPEGVRISQTYARDGVYIWYEADNQTNRLPFER